MLSPKKQVPRSINTSERAVRQILFNLIGNAIKFNDNGGNVWIAVDWSVLKARFYVNFKVSDDGPGMDEETMRSLFQRYVRGDEGRPGTGLGLAISQEYAACLKSKIVVDSQLGAGSTFSFAIDGGPVEQLQLEVADNAIKPRDTVTPLPVLTGLFQARVLLAEDLAWARDNAVDKLKLVVSEVITVEDGAEAVRVALEAFGVGQPFDVVLMDMNMRPTTGYEATRQLRAAGYTGLVIALTAFWMPEDKVRILAAGCDEHFKKPVDIGRLLKSLKATRASASLSDVSQIYSAYAIDDARKQELPEALLEMSKIAQSFRDYCELQDWSHAFGFAHDLKHFLEDCGYFHVGAVVDQVLMLLRERGYADYSSVPPRPVEPDAAKDLCEAAYRLSRLCNALDPSVSPVYQKYCRI